MSSSTESSTQDFAVIALLDDCKESDGEKSEVDFKNALRVALESPKELRQSHNMLPIANFSISRFEKDFEKGKCIGQGGFGKVYQCESLLDKQSYAIKEIRLKSKDVEELEKQIMECRNHAQFVHLNIVRYYDAWLECDNSSSIFTTHVLYIKMELCNDTLENYIQKRMTGVYKYYYGFDQKVMTSLIRAIEFLHGKRVIHRDIKPNNIFIKSNDGQDTILLGDFGRARNIQAEKFSADTDSSSGMSSNVGTFLYSAPELSSNNYTQSVDIYSIGVVLYDLFNASYTREERIVKLNELRDNGKPSNEFSFRFPEIARIIHSMVSTKPDKRPHAKKLLTECKSLEEIERDEMDLLTGKTPIPNKSVDIMRQFIVPRYGM
uniref:Protein kinase domain-containing protein n=1 Tax=Panagrellus redivivus TaxID=6233 RepID=A0A7E4W6I1_PANRE